jgi:hypothetical protein
MELVDMPGTNAFNPWDDQVNARLKQRVGGLAIVTNGTQLNDSVMEWFKETSILPEIAGASQRNQVRVFVLKTFVDQLNLPETDEDGSEWESTRNYCRDIEKHLRHQVMELIRQRFSAPNEIKVLADFVDRMPVHFLSAKVYRNLADDGLKKRVLANPTNPKNLQLFAAFQRFNQSAQNTGVPKFCQSLYDHTEEFITSHYRRKLELDFEKEVGLVAHFFRIQRVGVEQRLVQKGEFVAQVDTQIREALDQTTKAYRESSERKVVDLKRRFNDEIGKLLDAVAEDFGRKTRRKLEDWAQLHWASLRCAGRKNGQHTTTRGYEIDFNGDLADFCVEALNSSWISYRANLRKLLYDDLLLHFLPEIEKKIAQAKGLDAARIELIEATYERVAETTRHELELQVEKYDSEAEAFDALRPKLTVSIRSFLGPTYADIASEIGRGSAAKMRGHLREGVLSSIHEIGKLVRQVVKESWQGLTGSVEQRVTAFFDNVETGYQQQGDYLKKLAAHPPGNDENLLADIRSLEQSTRNLVESRTVNQKEAA